MQKKHNPGATLRNEKLKMKNEKKQGLVIRNNQKIN